MVSLVLVSLADGFSLGFACGLVGEGLGEGEGCAEASSGG